MKEIKTGLKYETVKTVEGKDTAEQFGSGGIAVFATPMMVGIMENAALNCVAEYLDEGQSTVGIHLDIKHLAATPVGMQVKAVAELIEIDGRKLRFKVDAYDEEEKIGEGFHERFIIDTEKFIGKIKKKRKG